MSQLQTVKTAIHEMAHQKLHSMENDLTKNSKEVEAESVAYTVCQHFGIDTSDYSFGYIAGWSEGKETPELKASLQTIRNAAKEMINDIEGHLLELTKENDIEKDAEDLAVKLDRFAYDYDYYGYQDAVDDPEESVLQTKYDLLSNENIILKFAPANKTDSHLQTSECITSYKLIHQILLISFHISS